MRIKDTRPTIALLVVAYCRALSWGSHSHPRCIDREGRDRSPHSQLARVVFAADVAGARVAADAGQAVFNPLRHDLGHQRVQAQRRGDQEGDAGVFSGGFGGQGGDVNFSVGLAAGNTGG